MKNAVIIVLCLVLLAIFAGCGKQQGVTPKDQGENNTKTIELIKDGNVSSVSVASLPPAQEYTFSGEAARAIQDYLKRLTLSDDFEENPNEYGGCTWTITLQYDTGDSETVYHFGNMFIRSGTGPWYRMKYEEAVRFENLISELESDN